MADWLDDAYRLQMHITRFDPSARYRLDSGSYDRLVFVYNGNGDFISGGNLPIPYVGLRDLKNPKPGSEDWFGWLSHEMTHDFWHKHPAFEKNKIEWGEGMCDYSRYYILLNMGLPRAAKNWKQGVLVADYHDRYRGGARILLEFDEFHHLDGPAGLWAFLWDRNFDQVLGKPDWK